MKTQIFEDAAARRRAVELDNALTETVIGYRRERLRKAPKPREDFEAWLDSLLAEITDVQVVRQSSKNRREYAQHFETATTYREADPDVAAVRIMDIGALLDGNVPAVPTFRVEKRHLRGGGRSRAFIGTAVVVGRTLFLFVLNSAAEGNLEGLSEDADGNAFTALVQTAVRRLSYRQWARDLTGRLWVHFPDTSRLSREERHSVNLVNTLQWASVILRITDTTYPKLDDAETEMVLSILLKVPAQELKSIVQRLFGKRFGILRAGQWLGQEAPPITHRRAVVTESNELQSWTEQDPHQLAPRDDAAAMMQGLVDTVLASAGDRVELGPAGCNPDPKAIPDWKHCAKVAGRDLGVESRDWKHINRGGLPVHRLSGGGAANLRHYLDPRWVEGWRTGRTPGEMAIPKVIASSFGTQLTEYQEWVERADGTVAVRTLQEMPLPEMECDDPACQRKGHLDADGTHRTHGYGIPDWKWDRLQELLERTSRRSGEHVPGRGHGADARRHPFASAFQWTEGDRQFKLRAVKNTKHGPAYQLYVREAGDDPDRGWTYGPDESCLASLVATEFHQGLGVDLERLLHDIGHELVALTSVNAGDDDPDEDDPVARATMALEQAREAAEAATKRARTARRARLLAKGELAELEDDDAHPEALEEARKEVVEAETMVEEATAAATTAADRMQGCEERLATAHQTREQVVAERKATVDLSQHLVVAKALQKAAGANDRRLNDAVLQMLDPDHTRIEVLDDDHRKVIVRPTWRFVSADTREVLTYQRSVHTPRLRANPKTKAKNVDLPGRDQQTIPRLLLRDGRSRTEVGERFDIGFRPGDTKAYGFQVAGRWLDTHGIHRKLHQALLDAPRIVRRALYLKRTGDQHSLDQLLGDAGVGHDWVELLEARYTAASILTRNSWPATWAAASHEDDRAVVNALLGRGGRATVGELTADTGLSAAQVARTAHVVPHSQRHLSSPKFAQPAAACKAEWRSKTIAPLADRDLWLPACPHDDCKGLITRPLWTPETDPPRDAEHQHSGLCPTCRRTPWGEAVFPADYLDPWSGPLGRTGGHDTRKTTVLTVDSTSCAASAA